MAAATKNLELLKIFMLGRLRSLFRRHVETQTTEQTTTCLSVHPLRSCMHDCRFALCHLTISVWQTLSRHAANAMPSYILWLVFIKCSHRERTRSAEWLWTALFIQDRQEFLAEVWISKCFCIWGSSASHLTFNGQFWRCLLSLMAGWLIE